jgi:lactobin A/cerein 7B family class IIb bacteriocin
MAEMREVTAAELEHVEGGWIGLVILLVVIALAVANDGK